MKNLTGEAHLSAAQVKAGTGKASSADGMVQRWATAAATLASVCGLQPRQGEHERGRAS